MDDYCYRYVDFNFTIYECAGGGGGVALIRGGAFITNFTVCIYIYIYIYIDIYIIM